MCVCWEVGRAGVNVCMCILMYVWVCVTVGLFVGQGCVLGVGRAWVCGGGVCVFTLFQVKIKYFSKQVKTTAK